MRLFSSIWLGITLLTILFVYSSIGSAGLPVGPGMLQWPFLLRPDAWVSIRELRLFEMTEFEWFHYWPFDLLIGLICVNLIVATLRRIPFTVVNLGVWMIHSGIIILSLGSVWYFSTKVEGDTPVARRRVVIQVPGQPPASMVATPGNRMVVGSGADAWGFEVQSIDPGWEIRSGEDAGEVAYSVSVSVQSPRQQFIRQLLAGYPQYTEDVIRTGDPQQPMARAVKAIGKPLVDETVKIALELDPQRHFYLMSSAAVYLREVGQESWVERPIEDLPRFHEYIATRQDVWLPPGPDGALEPDPLDIVLRPSSPDDPMPGVDLRVSRYLPYAQVETRRLEGGDQLDPAVSVRLRSAAGEESQYQLVAFDPARNTAEGGLMSFRWARSAEEREALEQVIAPQLQVSVPAAGVSATEEITAISAQDPSLEFTPIAGTEYAYRVERIEHGLTLGGGRVASLAIVDIKSPERTFRRWVFDNPAFNRDMPEGELAPEHTDQVRLDDGIRMTYVPGRQPPPVTIIAGPAHEDLGILIVLADREPRFEPVELGTDIEIGAGIVLTVDRYAAHTFDVTKPAVVPRHQRDRDVGVHASMIMLDVPAGGDTVSTWLQFHQYPFASMQDVPRRFPYRPSTLRLADGRRIEVLFSRRRLPLPAPVALDGFEIKAHVGGFTGQTSSVLDWISMVQFADADGWSDPVAVSVNNPQEHDGYWFFQAQWDPPDQPRFEGDPGSAGLNYTVLGVGNRNGVVTQLAGCCIAVLGMLYAFYVKPIIKRRRQAAVHHAVAERREEWPAEASPSADERSEAVPVGWEQRS